MEYRVLGPLEVRVDGVSLSLGGEKQRALLALLLLNANRVVSRERLIDELWGDDSPETVVQTVQVYVSRLRKLLPPETLVTRPPGYVLAVAPDAIDLQRFERLAADARNTDPERASHLLREALQLWRGPALDEFREEPFAQLEAARLEDLRVAALEERIEADLSLGRHADLVGELETLVAANPHRERLCGQLMLALYRSGRQAEALEVYRSARAALDELGIEPSAALRGLEKAILTQDASLAARRPLLKEAQPLPGLLVPSSPFPFVGRVDELATLRALVERAGGGEGSFVLLTGEPGAGKTRLVRELAHEAAGSGVLVCYGASDAAVRVPYQPVRDWFEFLLRVCTPEALAACVGDGAEVLVRLAPGVAALTGGATGEPGEETTTDRYQLQAAVADFLRRLGAMRPLLLVAEDIHWSDGETLALLARLARVVPDARVVVVATFRKPGEEINPELADTLADFSRLEGVTRIALPRLSADDVGAFVRDATGARASAELLAAIGELTDGTPLLLCELWRELVDGGGLQIEDANVTLARPLAELRGLERIGELVEHRVSRLSPETGAMIEVAAVTGPRFELALVAAAAGLDQASLAEAVQQAARSGIIEEVPARAPACRFTHELVRRAIYDRIPRVRLPELHLRVGEALAQSHADEARILPELAHHFTLAAPLAGPERAVEYNLRAADIAGAAFAYGEAAERLSTALDLGITDRREHARVQAELGYLLNEAGRIADSEAILVASLDAATSLGERALAERTLVHILRQRLGHDPAANSADFVPLAEEAIRTFEQLDDPGGLAAAEFLLGDALHRGGRTQEAFTMLERALEHATAAGNEVMRRDIVGTIARRLCENATPVAEAIDRLEQLRATSHDLPMFDAGIRRCLAAVLAMAGRFDESRRHIEETENAVDTAHQTTMSYSTHWLVAEAKELAGDLDGAERELTTAFTSLRDARGEKADSLAMRAAAVLALLYCDQDRWDEAAELLVYGKEVDGAPPAAGKVYTILRLAARARVAAHDGCLDEGLDLARRAVDFGERSDWPNYRAIAWLALAEVAGAAGETAESDDAVANALRLYEAKGNVAAAARLKARLVDSPLKRA